MNRRTKRINPISKKRLASRASLKKKHDAYKSENNSCEYHRVIGRCLQPVVRNTLPIELEHVWQQAGGKIEDISNWLSVCRPCHNWKHGHSVEGHIAGIWCKVAKREFNRDFMRKLVGKDLIGWVDVARETVELDDYFYDLATDILERF